MDRVYRFNNRKKELRGGDFLLYFRYLQRKHVRLQQRIMGTDGGNRQEGDHDFRVVSFCEV